MSAFRPMRYLAELCGLSPSGAARAPRFPTPDLEPALLEDLVASYHVLVREGVLDAYGHVSVRHPRKENCFVMARSGEVAPAYVTPSDMMEFDFDSKPLDHRGQELHSERFIHGEIYKLRRDVNAIVHSHSRAVIPFTVTETPLRALFHSAAFLGTSVPVFEIRDTAGENNQMLVNNNQLGRALGQTLGGHTVALMRGHGNVVVAASLDLAIYRAIYTEINAALQMQAVMLGGPINYLNQFEVQKNLNIERAWVAWKRRVRENGVF